MQRCTLDSSIHYPARIFAGGHEEPSAAEPQPKEHKKD
jgi:hypothetical protein